MDSAYKSDVPTICIYVFLYQSGYISYAWYQFTQVHAGNLIFKYSNNQKTQKQKDVFKKFNDHQTQQLRME